MRAGCLVGILGVCVASSLLAEDPTRVATWRERRVEFVYAGRGTRYSCEGLTEKVRALLLELGARSDLELVPSDCRDVDRARPPAGQPRLRIVFFAPMPSAGVAAAGVPLRARFEPFALMSDAFGNLGVGDCELVQGFADQILPRLSVRRVIREISCSPLRPSGNRYRVRGEVLKMLEPAMPR